jgi:hypothetical protein
MCAATSERDDHTADDYRADGHSADGHSADGHSAEGQSADGHSAEVRGARGGPITDATVASVLRPFVRATRPLLGAR